MGCALDCSPALQVRHTLMIEFRIWCNQSKTFFVYEAYLSVAHVLLASYPGTWKKGEGETRLFPIPIFRAPGLGTRLMSCMLCFPMKWLYLVRMCAQGCVYSVHLGTFVMRFAQKKSFMRGKLHVSFSFRFKLSLYSSTHSITDYTTEHAHSC